MKEGAAAPSSGRNPIGEHPDDGVEILPRKMPVRICPAREFIEVIFPPRLASRCGDDLLGEDIKRPWRDRERIQRTCTDRTDQRCTLEQLISCGRKQPSFWNAGGIHAVA